MSSRPIVELVPARLRSSNLSEGARRLVLAAVTDDTDLKAALASPSEAATTPDGGGDAAAPSSVWLRNITVKGFRGVGPSATLAVEPGPGLTLLVGRNGSGKSSFAEGIEVALTGRNERLKGKTVEWQKQWRNIHDGASAEITVEFQVDGETKPLTVRRSWVGNNLNDTVAVVNRNGEEQSGLPGLGWGSALEQYRPFLSYDDLGKVSDKPSIGFDLLVGVLGLEAIGSAQDRLTAMRTEMSKVVSEPEQALPTLLKDLDDVDDDRARRVKDALVSSPQDLAAVRDVLSGGAEADRDISQRAVLSRIAALAVPDLATVASAASELRAARTAAEALKGTDSSESAALAGLLDAALAHHSSHGDGRCPVCGQGTLDASWRQQTSEQIIRLRQMASAAIEAQKRLKAATAKAQGLITAVPAPLTAKAPDGISTASAASAWGHWAALADVTDMLAFADDLETRAAGLSESVTAVRTIAADALRAMENAWRPAAARVQRWLDLLGIAAIARKDSDDISAALSWIKEQAEQLRDERLAPFSDYSARIWADLRQESNVDLGPIAFSGSGRTRRKLDVPVKIDGTAGGVPMLSNGELHALGLALFLPRSTAPESPFRFVVIDDPVQAMDPTKVEGLAQVLHGAAADRQVIVLTHDERLSEALRHLMLPATILEVSRRENSQVEVVPNQDPVRRYLDDARRITSTTSLPDDLAAIAVAGTCRDAIEAACQRAARRKLRRDGVSISGVDDRLTKAQTTMHRVALALLGDARRTAQVMPTLNRLAAGRWAGDVLRDVREGAHQSRADLERIIGDSGRLCDLILADSVR